VKFILREIGSFFPLKYEILSVQKFPKLLNFMFPNGLYIVLIVTNTELKRSSEVIFSVSERHRWAVVGQEKQPSKSKFSLQ